VNMLTERQEQLAAFIAEMVIVPKALLEERFGRVVDHDLKRLKALGLARHRPWIGRATLWQLTAAGCHLLGLSEGRAKSLGSQALHQKLMVGQLVNCDGYRLLNRAAVAEVLPDAPPSVTFVHWQRNDQSTVFRLLTPGPFTDPRAVVRSIRQIEERRDQTKFNGNEFGYLIVAVNRLQKKAIGTVLKRAHLYGQSFLLRIVVVGNSTQAD
jgi:hypothetical protein